MKKGLLSLTAFLFALVAVPQAHALVGGPFDNGDYNSLIDDSGVYQAAFRFKNGSGFAQFGTNVSFDTFDTAGGSTPYSVLNRSLFYYKGLTFLGTASGIVDHERKRITGFTNGSSDVSTTSTTTTGTSNNAQITPATTTLLTNGGSGLPCSSQWDAKITKSRPVLRFTGKGELSVINPTLAQIGLNALEQLVSSSPTGNTGLGAQISALVTGLQAANDSSDLFLSTLQNVSDNSDKVKMHVFGSRVFFVSTR